jgi:hypothetical protein
LRLRSAIWFDPVSVHAVVPDKLAQGLIAYDLANLNGPEVLSGLKMASIWSRMLANEIRYSGDDMDAFEEQMRSGLRRGRRSTSA